MAVKVSYSKHVIQIDFGHSATDNIEHITPDLQQRNDVSMQARYKRGCSNRGVLQAAGMADL